MGLSIIIDSISQQIKELPRGGGLLPGPELLCAGGRGLKTPAGDLRGQLDGRIRRPSVRRRSSEEEDESL